jgi:hypothetical protein
MDEIDDLLKAQYTPSHIGDVEFYVKNGSSEVKFGAATTEPDSTPAAAVTPSGT